MARQTGTPIRVAVAGAAGRMGETVCEAVDGADDMELVARADPALGLSLTQALSDHGPDVLVDFTIPSTAVANAHEAVAAGVHVVIGTTGFPPTHSTICAAPPPTCSSPRTSRSARF